MKYSTLTLGLTLAVSLGAIAGCGTTEEDSPQASEGSEQKLVMVTSADYPPFEFYETVRGEGEPTGFDIDIAKYISHELGYDLEIRDMDFSALIPALQSKRADLAISSIAPTEERQKSVDFSNVYFEVQNTIVAKKEADYKQYKELAGKKVGVQLGSTQEQEAKAKAEEIGNITLESRNRLDRLVQEVKVGRIDAVIVPGITVAQGYVRSNPDLGFNQIEDAGDGEGLAIAFPKDSELVEPFNEVLQDMQDNGEMERLVKKWFVDYQQKEEKTE